MGDRPAARHTRRGWETTHRGVCFHLVVLGINLRLSGFAASSFIHWAASTPKHRVLTGFFPVSCPREPSANLCGHAAFFLASLQLKSSQLTTSYLSALFLATSVPGGVFIYLFLSSVFSSMAFISLPLLESDSLIFHPEPWHRAALTRCSVPVMWVRGVGAILASSLRSWRLFALEKTF